MKAIDQPTQEQDIIADFCRNIMQINNGGIVQIGQFMASQSVAERARFIERCSAMAGQVAETLTGS